MQTHLRQPVRRLAAHRPIVQESRMADFAAQEDILGNCQVFGQVDFLMDQHDASGLGLARAVEMRRTPVDKQCRSEEHTSELQSIMRISYAVFCLNKKNKH